MRHSLEQGADAARNNIVKHKRTIPMEQESMGISVI